MFPMNKKWKKKVSRATLIKRLAILRKAIYHNTDEFCKNSTLHGLKYLTSRDLYPLERMFFGVAFAVVVFLSGYFVLNVYEKWNTTPVIYSLNPEATLITKDPFPAVTICNVNQASKREAEKYSVFSVEYAMLQMLCKREVNVTIADTITDWTNLNGFITKISQPCSSMLLSCQFGGAEYNCSELFRPTITDEGLCCSFNMIHPSFLFSYAPPLDLKDIHPDAEVPVEWNVEKGYPKKLPSRFYPRMAVGTGESLGLSVVLDVESENYYCSSGNSIGFKISVHNPSELPNMREIGLLMSAGVETKVRVVVQKWESVPSLRSMNKQSRKCLFQNEENLLFFKHYTQRNCETECMAHLLLTYCGCIAHYHPKLTGNETICSIYELTCVERIRLYSKSNDKDSNMDCNNMCMTSCYDLTYLPDFFSAPLSHKGFRVTSEVVSNISSSYVEKNIAVLNMYFQENSFRSTKQTEFFGVTDALSSVGGLIGLFFGFSFISLAEFFFYSVIRPCRKNRQVTPGSAIANGKSLPSTNSILKRFNKKYQDPFNYYAKYTPRFGRIHASKELIDDKFLESISQRIESGNHPYLH